MEFNQRLKNYVERVKQFNKEIDDLKLIISKVEGELLDYVKQVEKEVKDIPVPERFVILYMVNSEYHLHLVYNNCIELQRMIDEDDGTLNEKTRLLFENFRKEEDRG